MRVGVVSDTHLPRFGRSLPSALVAGLREAGVALVLHLGDFTEPWVAALFEQIAPFDGVAGNNDGEEIRKRYGRQKVLEFGGARIGLVHGDEGAGATTRDRAWRSFAAESAALDAVLFGHSHIPLCEVRDRVLLLNPGSPTDKRRQARYSYGLLSIAGGRVRGELRFYDDRAPS